jgi:L-alanine-DL-glutamate epimerase-like enolase superfamily enzyme
VRLRLSRRTLRFTTPVRASYGELRSREVLTVTLTDPYGLSGHGDVAPLEPYDGVSMERVMAALERYRPRLEQAGDFDPRRIMTLCRAADDLPAALSAIDLALWDIAGRRRGRPVSALLAGETPSAIEVNATIAAQDRQGASEQAARAVRQGFSCLKLKVGLGDDAGRVAAVRAAAGPGVALRLDANGAWDTEEAVRTIQALEPAGLELVEEPVHGLEAMRAVRERVTARVAMDETAAQPGAFSRGVADAVCLKLAPCGGIKGLIEAAAMARKAGMDVYLASMWDGPLAVAGAVHAAAAMSSAGALPACGLATVPLFAETPDVLTPANGRIAVPQAPGLGVEPV